MEWIIQSGRYWKEDLDRIYNVKLHDRGVVSLSVYRISSGYGSLGIVLSQTAVIATNVVRKEEIYELGLSRPYPWLKLLMGRATRWT